MARTLTKEKPLKDQFLTGLETVFDTPVIESAKFDTEHWEEKPVDIVTFCRDFRKKPLWPIQEGFAEEILGDDPTIISQKYIGGMAFWGKGSGKDMTISDLQCYIAYWCICLKRPQQYLREILKCSIADDDAIDFGNVSINERQAKNVFFKKFKAAVRGTINPHTGNNWFEEKGLDLREGYGIQKTEVQFPKNIFAHSLNSETHTGEGLNLFFVTVDEFGSFAIDKAFVLLDALQDSSKSRFKRVCKVCVISYKYNENDPMHILYNQWKNDSDYYVSKAATYEVNIHIEKSDLAKSFEKNPDKAKRTYECGESSAEGGYITRKYMLDYLFNKTIENPIIGDLQSIIASHLPTLRFKKWFKPVPGRIYAAHFDLAKGKIAKSEGGGDAAGFVLCHPETMKPEVDSRIKKELRNMGVVNIEGDSDEEKKGIVYDLMLQLVADVGSEIEISECRKFILRLRQMGFQINWVTYDGWQSLESIQQLKNQGINAEVLSVDKDSTPYDFVFKELLYQKLVKGYFHKVAKREAAELIVTDKGKIEHPEKSWERWLNEGEITDAGSKDVTDAMAGSGFNAWQNISLHSGTGFLDWGDDDD
jgi:hypothetical protein